MPKPKLSGMQLANAAAKIMDGSQGSLDPSEAKQIAQDESEHGSLADQLKQQGGDDLCPTCGQPTPALQVSPQPSPAPKGVFSNVNPSRGAQIAGSFNK